MGERLRRRTRSRSGYEQRNCSYKPDLLTALTRRELWNKATGVARETGLTYVEAGRTVEGVYRRSFELASGRFAMIEKAREFTLVPWRPVLERNLGQAVFGIARGESISWSIGRQRSGPSVS